MLLRNNKVVPKDKKPAHIDSELVLPLKRRSEMWDEKISKVGCFFYKRRNYAADFL